MRFGELQTVVLNRDLPDHVRSADAEESSQ